MSRLRMYIAGSAVLANVVLLRAYYERPNFYSAAVYISQSTGSLMFLINLALIVTASLGYGLQRLFYGRLRAIETEQLYDKAWFAVSETLLAMTIFRDDIGIWFFAMFLCLLAGKVWQWIGEGRVELLEQQPPRNPRLFHARLMSSLLLSVAFDIFMVNYCTDHILSATRPGVMVMFGFEYVLLAIASMSTLLRYLLSLVEIAIIHKQEKTRQEARRLAREQAAQRTSAEGEGQATADDEDDEDDMDVPGWEEKGRWVFYLELATDFIKSVVYLGFFVILMAFYGIPIHIMRDLFMTIRSFLKRINDFIQYRNATRDMNARYPDATAEELGRENTCIVCREEMRPWVPPGDAQAGQRVDERQRPKKLPCGHILHFSCLRSWLERQQVCPTCRRPVLAEAPPTNTQPNNQANHAQQNQGNQQNQQNLFGGFRGLQPNAPQAPAGQPGQQGQQQNAQQNGGAGNFRVFNLGRLRIVLGNMRIPEQQQGHGAVNNVNNDQAAAMLTQRLAQMHQAQVQTTTPFQFPRDNGAAIPATQALHPADIQSDILRLQQNIIDSVRTLRAQHEQLDIIHSLLAELQRIQQASGVTAVTGQQLPIIAPLNLQAPLVPQAYFANGPILRHGDVGLPEGLTLPEGWTLRPMALAPPAGVSAQNTESSSQNRAVPDVPAPTPTREADPPSSSMAPSTQTEAGRSQPSSSVSVPERAAGSGTSAEKTTEPTSMGSSWSFENIGASNEASGSSSAVAGGSTESSNLSRRTVTVEDAEDNEHE